MTVREVILNTSTGQLDVELSNDSSFEVNLGEVVVLTQDDSGNPVYRSGGDDIVFGAAGGITVEQAVDGVAAALLAGTHSGVTVAYDDPNNKINLTVSGVAGAAGAPQVNADWNATSGVAQILNKPTIPSAYTDEMAQDAVAAALIAGTHSGVTVAYDDTNNKINLTASGTGSQVNSDWNASSGVAQILNKPTIPTQYTDEMAQDAVAAALAAGTHTNITVTYDDANNKINLAATAGGSGGSYVKRKVNLSANTGTATALVVGFGTQAQLDAATITVDSTGTILTVGNVTGGLVIQSITITYTDNFTSGTTFEFRWPAIGGATTIDQISFPDMLLWNAAYVRQAQNNTGVDIVSGNVSLKRTGFTSGVGMAVKAVCF